MFQNIRVDIAYYKTNTDFEMEFNLCGCCRMRLLTDKSSDRQTLVHSLARAVSRSKVIIVVGSLFGDDGIIKIVAGAIGSSLTVADNKSYGLDEKEEIQIINGSTPLITPEGYFGGCIIENGPQTMILLTESKSIRKSIMQTLIHPYIEELCAIELKEKAAAATANTAEPVEEAVEETVEEPQEEIQNTEEVIAEVPQEDVVQEAETEPEPEEQAEEITQEQNTAQEEEEPQEAEITVSGGMSFETDDEVIEEQPAEEEEELYVEPMAMKRREARLYNEAYSNFEEENNLNIDDEDYVQDVIHRRGFLDLPILIISVILLVLIACLCYCIFYVPSKYGMSSAEYIRDIFNTLFG